MEVAVGCLASINSLIQTAKRKARGIDHNDLLDIRDAGISAKPLKIERNQSYRLIDICCIFPSQEMGINQEELDQDLIRRIQCLIGALRYPNLHSIPG